MSQMPYSHVVCIVLLVSWRVPGSYLGAGRLPHQPRLGALPAVPRHPIGALAHLITVPRAAPAGGALAAALEVFLLACRLRGAAGGRHAARAAAPPTEHRERLSKVGVLAGAEARDVERGGPRGVPVYHLCGELGAVGTPLDEHLRDVGAVPGRGIHERREAGPCVVGHGGEVNVCAASQEGEGDLVEALDAGFA